MTKTAPRPTRRRSEPKPEREPKPKRRLGAGSIALITAAVALGSAAIGLVFDLKPDLRPDPRTTLSAELSVFAVERAVTIDDWLRRTTPTDRYPARRDALIADAFEGEPSPSPAETREQLDVPGQLFYVKTRIVGFKRRALKLRWSMYDARTQLRLEPQQGLNQVTGDELVGQAPTDESVRLVWTPAVVIRGEAFARFELLDPDGVVLAVADSPKFRGLRI